MLKYFVKTLAAAGALSAAPALASPADVLPVFDPTAKRTALQISEGALVRSTETAILVAAALAQPAPRLKAARLVAEGAKIGEMERVVFQPLPDANVIEASWDYRPNVDVDAAWRVAEATPAAPARPEWMHLDAAWVAAAETPAARARTEWKNLDAAWTGAEQLAADAMRWGAFEAAWAEADAAEIDGFAIETASIDVDWTNIDVLDTAAIETTSIPLVEIPAPVLTDHDVAYSIETYPTWVSTP